MTLQEQLDKFEQELEDAGDRVEELRRKIEEHKAWMETGKRIPKE